MRLALLIKDHEYRKALEECIADAGGDVLLDIITDGEGIEKDALILTDAEPADIGPKLLDSIRNRTVFLTTEYLPDSYNGNLHILFKYCCVSRLLADISEVYCNWKGLKNQNIMTSRVIACCTDSDAFSQSRCTRLAAQIIYRQGGSVLILPLGYISDQGMDFGRDINSFARLMYRIRKGRPGDSISLSYTDSYGISRLILPRGRNPIAYLESEDVNKMITSLSSMFETVILDIGGCYREENLQAIRNANSVICFQTARNRINFEDLLLNEEDRERLRIIRINDESDEGFAIDEYVRELFGIEDED